MSIRIATENFINDKVETFNDEYGIQTNDGVPYIVKSSEKDIDEKTNDYKPIVPTNLDYGVKKALSDCKLSGDNAWTKEEQTNARKTLGTVGVEGINDIFIEGNFEDDNLDNWTITNTGSVPIEVVEDAEQGKVLYIGAKTSANKIRRIESQRISIPDYVTSFNVSFKYKIDGTSTGNFTFYIYEYTEDESSSKTNSLFSVKSTENGWLEYNETFVRNSGYTKIAFRLNALMTARVPIYLDSIKISYTRLTGYLTDENNNTFIPSTTSDKVTVDDNGTTLQEYINDRRMSIILVDEVTNEEYVVKISNGTLVANLKTS